MYLEERIKELAARVDSLEARVSNLERHTKPGDTVIRVGDEVEEIETGDRGIVTRIEDCSQGDRIYSRWGGGPELYVRRHECRKVS